MDMTRWDRTVPARAGVGFKPVHLEALLAKPAQVGFVEIHAENFMGDGGPAHAMLAMLREHFPLSVHGVGLSIGAEGRLDADHLARLARVVEAAAPGLVSEHLAWSTHEGVYFNDLLPLPYTEETLNRVVHHIDEVQDALGRPILLENPASYVAFEASTMDEPTFLRRVRAATGCGILLDVNNVVVSATNLGLDATAYMAALPLDAVGEIHLAGHAPDRDADGAILLIDAHDRPVPDVVWTLFADVIDMIGRPLPTLIEWDNDIPSFTVLASEARKADAVMSVPEVTRA